MTGEQSLSEREVFQRVLALDERERAAYLSEACGDSAALRQEVESLLAAHDEAGSFMQRPALEPPIEATDQHHAGAPVPLASTIGRYKLLEQIGEGGFGAVFMAEQEEPVRRIVALKIIKLGMDTRQVVARFEAERQALATMDHPHVAKVLDGGATETGRPYFVMELVKGIPITEYCDKNNLSIPERLRLFAQVCQAVEHAHQKGLIHRDLKPSNVLVAEYDGRPAPKIIDFGVAKATAQRLTEKTAFTQFGQIVGTFEYMSPEQAQFNQLDVDTRSDVYSLGVLLYELLVGSTPFEKQRLETVAFDETLRIIREEEPPKPSTRLRRSGLPSRSDSPQSRARRGGLTDVSAVAANRQTEPTRLTKTICGDLDWIVMKALDKDRNQRYETVSALAADICRHLADEPVTAGPPSRLYRAGKFVRRNKAMVFASSAVFVGLIVGIIGMAIGLVSQSRQRAEAQLNLAISLHSQGKYAEAEALYREGLKSASSATAEDRQRAARTRLRLAKVVYDQAEPGEAERLYREAFVAYRASFPPGDPSISHALITFALLLREQLRFDEAEPLFREAYEIYRRAAPADHRATGESATHVANTLITLGKYEEAEPIARAAISEHQAAAPIDVISVALARLELGRALVALGRYREAETEILEADRVLSTTSHFHIGILAPIALYTVWDQAEPGKGYGAKAGQWIRKLIETFVRLDTPTSDVLQEPRRDSE